MKKLISLLLVLCMVFSLMVVSVSADEVDPNLEGSWDYVNDNDVYDGDENPKDVVTRGDYAIYMARLVCPNWDTWTIPNDYDCVLTDMEGDTTELGKAVAYCYITGLVNGRGDGKYHPEQEVTREQICALLYRAYVDPVEKEGEPEKTAPLAGQFNLSETENVTTFTDDVSDWAVAAVEWAATYGIVVGHSDGTFGAGEEGTTQEQMAAILHRFVENETEAVTTTKFYLGVESGEGYAKVAVNHAYVMNVTLSPEKLNPAEVTLTAEMNDVASLKVSETKKHSVTVSTGLSGDPSLKDWMPQAWTFKDCNININITDGVDTKSCVYVVTGSTAANGDAVIAFVPENVEDTRAAWHFLVNDETLTIKEYAEDDSYIKIGALSYLHLGTEKLVMETAEDLILDNFSAMDELKQNIRDHVMLETGCDYALEASLDATTALRVGQTEAVLNVPVTLSIEGVEDVEITVLSDLRDSESTYDMASLLVKALGELISELDEMEEITVNVRIGE